MELQIQELVESIKNEGIEKAKKEAADIISDAEKKAEAIVAKAEAEAEKVYADNKKAIDVLKQSAKVSAQQAKRDAIITFTQEISEKCNNIIRSHMGKALNDATLAKLIVSVMTDCIHDPKDVEVEVAEVSDALKGLLESEIKNGLEIHPVKNMKSGLKMRMKDGSAVFDLSEDEIVERLSPFFGEIKF